MDEGYESWITRAVAIALLLTVLSILFTATLGGHDLVRSVNTFGMILAAWWTPAPWHTFRIDRS